MTIDTDRYQDVGGAVKKVVSKVIGVQAGLEISQDDLVLGSLAPQSGDASDFYAVAVRPGQTITIGLNKVPGESDANFDPQIVLWHPYDGWRASNDDAGSYGDAGDQNARLEYTVMLNDRTNWLIVEVTSNGSSPSGNYQLMVSQDGESVPFSAINESAKQNETTNIIVDPKTEETGVGIPGVPEIIQNPGPKPTEQSKTEAQVQTLSPEMPVVAVVPPVSGPGPVNSSPPASGSGTQAIQGTQSDDILKGDEGYDVIYGREGDDRIYANGSSSGTGSSSETNRIDAGSGNDRIYGSDGDDIINAGSGNDMVQGNGGNDIMNGRSGIDMVSYSKATGAIEMDFRFGTVTGGDGTDQIGGFENAFGSRYADRMIADELDNMFNGFWGDDVIAGMGGSDTLLGGDGDDVLVAHASRFGGGHSSQRDLLDGGRGNDELYGGSGNDRIIGGNGDDLLAGRHGDDVFVFAKGEQGHDRLLDFEQGHDVLEFSGLSSVDIRSGEDGLVVWYDQDASIELVGVWDVSTDAFEYI